MDTKRDTIILELVKYLINTDKHIPSDTQEAILTSNTASKQVYDTARGDTYKKLEDIQQSIEALKAEIKQVTSQAVVAPVHVVASKGSEELYQDVLNTWTEETEVRLQSLFSGAFVAHGTNRDFFLWSGNWGQQLCIVIMQAEAGVIGAKVLALIGSDIIMGISQEMKNTDEIMRQINKKLAEYHHSHPTMPKKLKAGVCLVDKKQAKVFFSGANMHLSKVDESGIDTHEGTKECAGLAQGQFDILSVSIKRGCTMYLHGNSQISGEIEKILKKTAEESSQEKKSQISKWLTKKNTNEAMIGLSF